MLSRRLLVCVFFSSVSAFYSNGPLLHVSNKVSAPVSSLSAGTLESLDDTNFNEILSGTVLVDACAPWCGPCKLIEPVLQRCAENWESILSVVKYDVETKTPDVKIKLLSEGVMPQALPSLILFKNGKAVAKHDGAITDDELDEFLLSFLEKPKDKSGPGFVSFAKDAEKDDYMLSEYR